MRFKELRNGYAGGSAVLAAACMITVLAACGGGEKRGADSSGMMNTTADTTAMAPMTTPSTATPAATTAGATASGGTAAAITGKTVDVKMIGDAKGYRFEPANFTVKVGDGARFTNVSGGPHDVTFWPDSIPAGTATQLNANMPNTTSPLTGPLLTTPNQTYVVSFAGLKPGVYHYYCTPHLALGMKGVITVQ